MRPTGFRVAMLMIVGSAVSASAQFNINDLTGLCGARYLVRAGAGTGAYDPQKNRESAKVLTWDALEKVRYGRTIRDKSKDFPSQSFPTRRANGFESTLWSIEGFVSCGSWGGREGITGGVGSMELTLEEDGPDSKGRTLQFGFPSTSCTYASPDFERFKDLNREIEPWVLFRVDEHNGVEGCGLIDHHVKIIGYGYFTDAGALMTSKDKGIAGSIFPVVDIIVLDEQGKEAQPPDTPDPKEAFIASWSITARNKKTSNSFRATQRDGIWVTEPFGAKDSGGAPLPSQFNFFNTGNNFIKPGIGDTFFVQMIAPEGKQLTTGGYTYDPKTHSLQMPFFHLQADSNLDFFIKGGAPLLYCSSPGKTSFSISRERWDCLEPGSFGRQRLHLVDLQANFSQQCGAEEQNGWTNVTGSISYTAPEQVPCTFVSSGTIENGGGSGGDGGNIDDGACPAGFDPATDCPDPATPDDPGLPPLDPPMIGLPGSATAHPLEMTSGESKTMRFTVVTMGDADVDLAVSSDSESVTAGLSRTSIPLPGTGTANLTISVRDDAPIGDYNVTVSATNVGLTATAPIRVAVRCDPPIILGIDQPRSTVINRGATATLEVKPGGSGPYKVQWYEGATGMTFNPIPGATERTFTTPALNQTTDYWVRVTNGCGSVDSNAAEVTVHF